MDSCPSNPPPVTNKYVWVKRRVIITKSIATGATNTAVNSGDISSALTGVAGDFSIRKVRAWFLPDSGIFPQATFTIYTKNLIDSTGTLPDAVYVDNGTGTSPPKLGFKVPVARCKNYEYDTAGVTDLMGLLATTGRLVCHVTVMQCISA